MAGPRPGGRASSRAVTVGSNQRMYFCQRSQNVLDFAHHGSRGSDVAKTREKRSANRRLCRTGSDPPLPSLHGGRDRFRSFSVFALAPTRLNQEQAHK